MKNKFTFLSTALLSSILILTLTGTSFAQWTSQSSGFSTTLNIGSISIANDTVIWASAWDTTTGQSSQIFTRTVNGGTTWVNDTIDNLAGYAISNIFAKKDTAWAALYKTTGDSGGIYRTNNAGASWTKQTTAKFLPPAGKPNFVYFFTDTNGICVGNKNGNHWEIYKTGNGGTLWSRCDTVTMPPASSTEFGFRNLYAASQNHLWFVSNEMVGAGVYISKVYHSANMGLNWSVTDTITGASRITSIAFRDTANGLLLNATGTLSSSNDGGATWTDIMYSGPTLGGTIKYVKSTPATWVCAGATGSFFTVNDGQNWYSLDAIDHSGALAFSSPNVAWSGTYNVNSTTGGMFSWNCRMTPPAVLTTGNAYCIGGPTSVHNIVGSGPSLQWYSDQSLSTLVESGDTLHALNIAVTDTFYVTQSTAGCPTSASASAPVYFEKYPRIHVTPPSAICAPNGITMSALTVVDDSVTVGSFSYWKDAAATLAQSGAVTDSGTKYIVKTTTFAHCNSDTVPVLITIHKKPNISVVEPASICAPNTMNLQTLIITDASGLGGTYTFWKNEALTDTVKTPSAVDQSGTYYILKTSSYGCSDTASVAINVVQLCLGVHENSFDEMSIYPNPSSGNVFINPAISGSEMIIKITNMLGENIYSSILPVQKVELNLQSISRGMYFINITVGEKTEIRKLILN